MLWLVLEVLVIAVVVLTSFPCSSFFFCFLLSSPAVTLLLCISPSIIAMILVQDHSC